jgi:hypothetical protein
MIAGRGAWADRGASVRRLVEKGLRWWFLADPPDCRSPVGPSLSMAGESPLCLKPPPVACVNQVGSVVGLRVGGSFLFEMGEGHWAGGTRLVLVAGGVGINPLLSILRHVDAWLLARQAAGKGGVSGHDVGWWGCAQVQHDSIPGGVRVREGNPVVTRVRPLGVASVRGLPTLPSNRRTILSPGVYGLDADGVCTPPGVGGFQREPAVQRGHEQRAALPAGHRGDPGPAPRDH